MIERIFPSNLMEMNVSLLEEIAERDDAHYFQHLRPSGNDILKWWKVAVKHSSITLIKEIVKDRYSYLIWKKIGSTIGEEAKLFLGALVANGGCLHMSLEEMTLPILRYLLTTGIELCNTSPHTSFTDFCLITGCGINRYTAHSHHLQIQPMMRPGLQNDLDLDEWRLFCHYDNIDLDDLLPHFTNGEVWPDAMCVADITYDCVIRAKFSRGLFSDITITRLFTELFRKGDIESISKIMSWGMKLPLGYQSPEKNKLFSSLLEKGDLRLVNLLLKTGIRPSSDYLRMMKAVVTFFS
jgi:hypothetical protein